MAVGLHYDRFGPVLPYYHHPFTYLLPLSKGVVPGFLLHLIMPSKPSPSINPRPLFISLGSPRLTQQLGLSCVSNKSPERLPWLVAGSSLSGSELNPSASIHDRCPADYGANARLVLSVD